MSEAEVLIRAEHLHKQFRLPRTQQSTLKGRILHPFQGTEWLEFQALSDASFEVRRGEFFGIVGRNGSGKSTLLKLLASIYRPTSGTLQVNGSMASFIELGIGFNPELSGRDNLFLNGALLGFTRGELRERYDAIVAFAELEEFMDLKLRNYSSGMQVRLGFSIAVELGADILLIDEVLAVGDERFQRKCYDIFRARKAAGATIVFVSHDMAAVQQFCDRAALLENGQLLTVGDPAEVTRAYHRLNMSDRPAARTTNAGAERVSADEIAVADTGPVSLLDRALIDAADERATQVHRNDRTVLSWRIRANEPIGAPRFTAVVDDHQGRHLLELDTERTGTATPRMEAGDELTVRFGFENVLTNGAYMASLHVADLERPELQASFEGVLTFESVSFSNSGAVNVPYFVEIEATADVSVSS